MDAMRSQSQTSDGIEHVGLFLVSEGDVHEGGCKIQMQQF
jgi:hypothetical protein